jgi:arylsulfatase A-like enzyme
MNTVAYPESKAARSRWRFVWSFLWAGATLGLSLGFLEGGLLFFFPRFSGLLRPDVDFVIWFVAPLVDILTGALLGLVLGLIASAPRRQDSAWPALVAAFGAGLAGAYLGWLLDWFRIGAGEIFPRRPGITTPIESFLIVFAAVLLGSWRSRRRATGVRSNPRTFSRRLAIINVITLCALACGVAFYAIWRPYPYPAQDGPLQAGHDFRPNIILMVLDTVRADHLSCYGYNRHTTPNIDAIASRGTLFENAYSSTSWTLASLASIFTGLLPHQHGADWGVPLSAGPWTLARILRSEGYETAGFSSNPFYGLGAWRLSEGFDVYVDDSYSVRHNVAATFVGQSVLQFLYDRLIRYSQFARRDAADVNQEVTRWYKHRTPRRPFFLFINQMDAHRPYLPPPPYDRRFGEIPHHLLPRLIATLQNGHPSRPYTVRERQAMIDGYDNSLAYLDRQIGNLLNSIDRPDSSRRTIVMITSDHGEGFGEHGTYDHGWNLYEDVLRVPLIIEGPGIPAGLRISSVVTNRELFSTVLDLAQTRARPLSQTSLSRFWNLGSESKLSQAPVVSELVADSPTHQGAAILSLVSSQWQYLRDSNGRRELYDLQMDPQEEHNLADLRNFQPTVSELQSNLKAQIAYSVLPWYAPAYVSPLDRPGAAFIERVSRKKLNLPAGIAPIGTAQDYFSHNPPSPAPRPSRAEQELLRSLPYH